MRDKSGVPYAGIGHGCRQQVLSCGQPIGHVHSLPVLPCIGPPRYLTNLPAVQIHGSAVIGGKQQDRIRNGLPFRQPECAAEKLCALRGPSVCGAACLPYPARFAEIAGARRRSDPRSVGKPVLPDSGFKPRDRRTLHPAVSVRNLHSPEVAGHRQKRRSPVADVGGGTVLHRSAVPHIRRAGLQKSPVGCHQNPVGGLYAPPHGVLLPHCHIPAEQRGSVIQPQRQRLRIDAQAADGKAGVVRDNGVIRLTGGLPAPGFRSGAVGMGAGLRAGAFPALPTGSSERQKQAGGKKDAKQSQVRFRIHRASAPLIVYDHFSDVLSPGPGQTRKTARSGRRQTAPTIVRLGIPVTFRDQGTSTWRGNNSRRTGL